MTTSRAAVSEAGARSGFWGRFLSPTSAAVFLIVYLAVVIGLLLSLDRASLWFSIQSTIVFPAFILSPLLIHSAPIPRTWKAVLIGLVMLIAMPIIGISDSSYLELAIQVCIFAGLALGLNIVVGFAGLLDLGYIAFFAVGAYVWGMFTSTAPTIFNELGILIPPDSQAVAFIIFIGIGILAAACIGILLGLPVLRLRGDYLAIVTLGFGEVIRIIARNGDSPTNFTNGSQGLLNVGRPLVSADMVSRIDELSNTLNIRVVGNLQPLTQQILFYFIAILMLGIILVVANRLQNSVIGRAWTAIREDEVAAIAMGVPLVRMKLMAFALGAAFAGAIGVLYGAKQTFVSPESFTLLNSISILAMVIVGGLGSIKGVLLGAMIVTLLQLQVLKNFSLQLNALKNIDYVILGFHIRDWPTQLEPAKYERFVFGILLVLMMLFRPAGLLPESRRRLELMQTNDLPDEPPSDIPGTPSGPANPAAAGD
ncbi:MAG: branched-chain amino acid ABC transporter permease [Anaerolineae bacterium]|nr:branched-chain amino acid ABC transporter permease [Anaerolineae bacterium]NUQ02898.1 branched-chain amino acid ABC transporter permease [Anaerolineae bacterium]